MHNVMRRISPVERALEFVPCEGCDWDFETGDVEAAARQAAVIVEGEYSSPLSAPASIETHVCLAEFSSEGHLDVWTGVHMAFMYRKALADSLDLDWREITVHQPPIGGSFGGKIDIDPIDFITVLLAKAARRPVKIHFSREEEFAGSRVRQPMHFKMRTGADADGNILFRVADVVSDNGAYNAWGSHALLVVMQSISSLYRVPNSRISSRVVYTNKAYGGSVRGLRRDCAGIERALTAIRLSHDRTLPPRKPARFR